MSYAVAVRVDALRVKLLRLASNAWTRAAFEPATARRIAGLRYWDGAGSS